MKQITRRTTISLEVVLSKKLEVTANGVWENIIFVKERDERNLISLANLLNLFIDLHDIQRNLLSTCSSDTEKIVHLCLVPPSLLLHNVSVVHAQWKIRSTLCLSEKTGEMRNSLIFERNLRRTMWCLLKRDFWAHAIHYWGRKKIDLWMTPSVVDYNVERFSCLRKAIGNCGH